MVTYRDLVAVIRQECKDPSHQDVMVKIGDQYYRVRDVIVTSHNTDEFDPGQLVLEVEYP